MEDEQRGLENKVWASRLNYAMGTFREINGNYWDFCNGLTNSEGIIERAIGYGGKMSMPFFVAAVAVLTIPSLVCVKYSSERNGYIEIVD